MVKSKSPRRLWDHCIELSSIVRSHMALDVYKLNGQVPETIMMGETADISFICEFSWYSWVYFNESQVQFPETKVMIGRYLGPTEPEVGSVLTAKILKCNGEVVRRNTFRHLRQEEYESEESKKERSDFDASVEKRLGDPLTDKELTPEFDISMVTPDYEVYEDEQNPVIIQEIDDYNPEGYDGYITAQVLLPKGEEFQIGTVVKRRLDDDGKPIGTSNSNPILDSREYEVEFDDGCVLEYSANVIAENLYSQVDAEGRRFVMLQEILDHQKDNSAVPKDDEFVVSNGKRVRRYTTKGWKLCILWKDGSTSWETLTSVKEAFPIEIAEYAVARKIAEETEFS